MARWKAHGQLSIRLNWTFFAIYYGSGVMRQICTARLFLQGVDRFARKFYLDRVVLINHSWHQKTRDTGLLDATPLSSLVLTKYRSVTDGRTDGRTHRQTDGRTDSLYCWSRCRLCSDSNNANLVLRLLVAVRCALDDHR